MLIFLMGFIFKIDRNFPSYYKEESGLGFYASLLKPLRKVVLMILNGKLGDADSPGYYGLP